MPLPQNSGFSRVFTKGTDSAQQDVDQIPAVNANMYRTRPGAMKAYVAHIGTRVCTVYRIVVR